MGGRDLKGSPYSRAPIARKGSSSKKLQFAEPDQQRPRPSPPARRSDGNSVGAEQRKEAGDPSPRKAKAVQAAPLLGKSRDHEFKRSMNNVQGYTENMLIRKSMVHTLTSLLVLLDPPPCLPFSILVPYPPHFPGTKKPEMW